NCIIILCIVIHYKFHYFIVTCYLNIIYSYLCYSLKTITSLSLITLFILYSLFLFNYFFNHSHFKYSFSLLF
ncbi:Hypothetical protein EHI5A_250850, partial [Entamoeba histolytica KU27]